MEPRCYRVCGFLIASSEWELLLFEPLDDAFFSGTGDCPLDSLFPVTKESEFVQVQTAFESSAELPFVHCIMNSPKQQAYDNEAVSIIVWFSVDTQQRRCTSSRL